MARSKKTKIHKKIDGQLLQMNKKFSNLKMKQNKDVYMVALRDESKLIGYNEKHEYRNSETMKPYDLW